MHDLNEVIELLKKVKPDVDFTVEKSLISDGILDSLDIVNIISEIEQQFHITVSPDKIDPDNFESAKAILNLLS